MTEKIMIIGEMNKGKICSFTLECIAAAETIADDAEIVVVLYGEVKAASIVEELTYYHVDKVIWVKEEPGAFTEEAYGQCILAILQKEKPSKIITSQTDFGKNIAPYISEVTAIPLISNVKDIKKEVHSFLVTRSIFSGKLDEIIRLETDVFIVAIKPNSWDMPVKRDRKAIAVEEYVMTDTKPVFSVVKVKKEQENTIDLLDAKVIVAGGRGIKNKEGMELVKKLATTLGGTVGVSRGAVELGLSDSSLQIGQTGKAVAPDIYIACGISGAIQHIVGMNGAKVVIAINNDPDAPIFQEADYCIVGDVFQVVPLLIQQLEDRE
ncbi:MAG: electron transfer flavoprotein subunit alpha/FixB family protein [Bacillus sp. (in: firmicutes)]